MTFEQLLEKMRGCGCCGDDQTLYDELNGQSPQEAFAMLHRIADAEKMQRNGKQDVQRAFRRLFIQFGETDGVNTYVAAAPHFPYETRKVIKMERENLPVDTLGELAEEDRQDEVLRKIRRQILAPNLNSGNVPTGRKLLDEVLPKAQMCGWNNSLALRWVEDAVAAGILSPAETLDYVDGVVAAVRKAG